ncbi:hypothetical protein [Shewanella sp. SR43-8]|uniref:hypothetical protein n=1 Tax=Shewanella sp. SR43-8 TaxID=2760938 RepID=UPI0016022D6C|nr:hypothetical protein [Shewanella sp. SR43-8]MBB1322131.1 hypothetical protein [Shewanella sp. SR43-8]
MQITISSPKQFYRLAHQASESFSPSVTNPYFKNQIDTYLDMAAWYLDRNQIKSARDAFEIVCVYQRLIMQSYQHSGKFEA